MNWISLAKDGRTPKVVVINGVLDAESNTLLAGLIYVYPSVSRRKLMMRDLETKERVRVKLKDEMLKLPLPGCWVNEDLEIADA